MREEEILRPVSAREFESEFRFSPGFRVRPVSAFIESQSTTSSSLSSSQKRKSSWVMHWQRCGTATARHHFFLRRRDSDFLAVNDFNRTYYMSSMFFKKKSFRKKGMLFLKIV
jgi:hypothetical protein